MRSGKFSWFFLIFLDFFLVRLLEENKNLENSVDDFETCDNFTVRKFSFKCFRFFRMFCEFSCNFPSSEKNIINLMKKKFTEIQSSFGFFFQLQFHFFNFHLIALNFLWKKFNFLKYWKERKGSKKFIYKIVIIDFLTESDRIKKNQIKFTFKFSTVAFKRNSNLRMKFSLEWKILSFSPSYFPFSSSCFFSRIFILN